MEKRGIDFGFSESNKASGSDVNAGGQNSGDNASPFKTGNSYSQENVNSVWNAGAVGPKEVSGS